MPHPRQPVDAPELEQIIDRRAVQVSPSQSVVDVVALMSQTGYVVVMEGLKLVGIFTAADAIELVAARTDLSQLKIAEVMTRQVVTLKQSQIKNIFTALSLFCQHQLSYLPIVDDAGQFLGIVTQNRLLQALQPLEQSATEQSTHLKQINQELQVALEEVQVAEEELRQQNEELDSAREALEIERQRYQDLFEFAPDGYLVTDPLGKIQQANQAAATLLNVAQKRLVGKPLILFIAKPDRTTLTIQMTQLQEFQDWEVNIQPRDGMIFPAAIAATSIHGSQGQKIGWRWSLRDITDRQQMERNLQAARDNLEQLVAERTAELSQANSHLQQEIREHQQAQKQINFQANILAHVNDAIIAIDNQHGVTYWNQAAEKLYGFKADEILGRRLETSHQYRWLKPEDEQAAAKALAATGTWRGENIHVKKNGEEIYVESSVSQLKDDRGTVIGLLAVIRDISTRKQAEAALYEREERLRLALTAARMGTWDWDILENDITYSDEMRLVFGMPPEAKHSTYEAFLDAIHPEDRASVVSAVNSAFEGKIDYWMEYRVLGSDGNWRWVSSKGQVYRDRHGKPARMVGVAMDITEKKQLEAQFLHIQRLESLGTLASGISHDLNNILTPILVVAQLLQLKYPDSERHEMLATIVANAKRGADLVKQVVSFARGVEGNRQTVQLQSSVIEVVQIVKQTFPKSIAIATDIPSDLWTVTADATQMHQVLMNLCVNARDAMPNGGKLTISATNFYVDEGYVRMHIEAKVGTYVVINITDTGCGISSENLDRIFDPFFTTKETGKGTGLGLSTALGIVKSHGGFIDVSSRIEVGTQFQVYLPSNEGSSNRVANDAELLTGRQELILVVDDETAIDLAIETTLTSHNYKVLTAKNGTEAIALYAQYKHEIDLVLIDMMMPEMDGTTAIQALQRMNPQVKIVAMSGMKSAAAIAQATNSSIQGFLPKPFTTQELLKTLHQLLP